MGTKITLCFLVMCFGGESVLGAEGLSARLLKRGNQRYIESQAIHPNLEPSHRQRLARGDARPFAALVTCSEPGQSPEFLFDQGIGDLHVIRSGGFLASNEVVDGIEQAYERFGVTHFVVTSHLNCRVFSQALEGKDQKAHRGALLRRIRMASGLKSGLKNLEKAHHETYVQNAIKQILEKSPLLRKLASEKSIVIEGGIFDEKSGKLEWLPEVEGLKDILTLPSTLVRKDLQVAPVLDSHDDENDKEDHSDYTTSAGTDGVLEVRAKPLDPAKRVISFVKSGNLRFSAGKLLHKEWGSIRKDGGSSVKAVVFSLSDSRMPTEFLVDASPEDLFVVRAEDLKLSATNIGALEWGFMEHQPPVLMILDSPDLRDEQRDPDSMQELVDELMIRSPGIAKAIHSKTLSLQTGSYNPESGNILWLDTPTGAPTTHKTREHTNGKADTHTPAHRSAPPHEKAESSDHRQGSKQHDTGKNQPKKEETGGHEEKNQSSNSKSNHEASVSGHGEEKDSSEDAGGDGKLKERHVVVSTQPGNVGRKRETLEKGSVLAAHDLLTELNEGNERFVKSDGSQSVSNQLSGEAARNYFIGNSPSITILAPSDLNLPVSTLFDQPPGTFFSVNIVGGVADSSAVASLELGVQYKKTPLIIFLGHDKCLAVTEILNQNGEVSKTLAPIMERMKPALARLGGQTSVINGVRANIMQSMIDTLKQSKLIRDAFHEGNIDFIGAIYHSDSGRIEWVRPGQKE